MTRPTRLVVVLVINVVLVVGLVIVGMYAHSVGVLAEGADSLGDAAGVGVALLAIWLGNRPPTPHHPKGYPRATTFAALVNGSWLFAICLAVAAEAIDRLATGPVEVHGLPVLIVSGIAGVAMAFGAFLLMGGPDGDEGENLNVRAVLLDTAADSAAALGVAVVGAIIFSVHGVYWLDPAAALAISVVVGYHATRLLARVARRLRTSLNPDAAVSMPLSQRED